MLAVAAAIVAVVAGSVVAGVITAISTALIAFVGRLGLRAEASKWNARFDGYTTVVDAARDFQPQLGAKTLEQADDRLTELRNAVHAAKQGREVKV